MRCAARRPGGGVEALAHDAGALLRVGEDVRAAQRVEVGAGRRDLHRVAGEEAVPAGGAVALDAGDLERRPAASPRSATIHWMGRPNATSPAPQRIDLRNGIASAICASAAGQRAPARPARPRAGCPRGTRPWASPRGGDRRRRSRAWPRTPRPPWSGTPSLKAALTGGPVTSSSRSGWRVGEAADEQREAPRGAVGVDGLVGEAELAEALLGQLGEGAQGALDERGGELLDADLEQEVARFDGHGRGTYPRTARSVSPA